MHCSCSSSLAHLPWTYVEVAALLKSTWVDAADSETAQRLECWRDTNTHDHLRVRTNESAIVRCSGSRSESLMQLCNTTLFVFPIWPHFFFFFFTSSQRASLHSRIWMCAKATIHAGQLGSWNAGRETHDLFQKRAEPGAMFDFKEEESGSIS